MVPSGMLGAPRSEDAGSVKYERWIEKERSKSDPANWRAAKEQVAPVFEAAPAGTVAIGIRVEGSRVTEEEIELDGAFDECEPMEQMWVPLQARRRRSRLPQRIPPHTASGLADEATAADADRANVQRRPPVQHGGVVHARAWARPADALASGGPDDAAADPDRAARWRALRPARLAARA